MLHKDRLEGPEAAEQKPRCSYQHLHFYYFHLSVVSKRQKRVEGREIAGPSNRSLSFALLKKKMPAAAAAAAALGFSDAKPIQSDF